MTKIRWSEALALAALVLIGLTACGTPDPEPATGAEPVVSAEAAALHEAARAGNLAEVRRLVEDGGVTIDAGDRYGASALMMAADRGDLELVSYLLGAGADVNHREVFFNLSAFDNAVWKERAEVAAALLAAGSDQRDDAVAIAVQQNQPGLALAAIEAGPLLESTVEDLRARDDLPAEIREIRELLERAETRPDPEPPAYTREQLDRFEGRFETWDAASGEEVQAEVHATDDGLLLTIGDEAPVQLTASGEREFRNGDGSIEAAFWGRLGTIESLSVSRDGEQPVRMRHSIAEARGAEAYDYDASAEAAAGATANWPQFRGHNASGVGEEIAVPVTWDVEAGTGVRWNVEIPGLGNSSPIVWGDRIVISTAVAEGIEQNVRTGLTGAGDPVDESVPHSWRVMAFDKRSGELLWDTEVGSGVPETRRHFKASQASSTPVTDGKHIVVVFPTAGMACLDLDGNVLWKHDLGGLNVSSPNDPGTHWGFASSPVIYDDRVIVQIDTYHEPHIAAWDLESGRQLWRTERDVPPSWATPTVVRGDGGDELVVNAATIKGYDPANGQELWSLAPNSELVIATPVVGDGVTYVSAGYAPVKPIYAVRNGTRGRFEVDPNEEYEQVLAWNHGRGGAYMPTPLLYRGILYLVHHNGRMVAYDADSGVPIYKTRFSQGGTFTGSPVAADGKLYLSTEEGQVYVIEAGPEYREIAVNEMNEPLMATPALSEGTLFLRTTRRLVAIGG